MFTSFNLVKNFFITVEYDIIICLFWAGFFPGFFNRVTGFFGYVPGCPNPVSWTNYKSNQIRLWPDLCRQIRLYLAAARFRKPESGTALIFLPIWWSSILELVKYVFMLLVIFHSTCTETAVFLHCELEKNTTKCFLIYSLQNMTNCDEIWHILSWLNLSHRNVNAFRLTWMVSLLYFVKLSIRVLQVNNG